MCATTVHSFVYFLISPIHCNLRKVDWFLYQISTSLLYFVLVLLSISLILLRLNALESFRWIGGNLFERWTQLNLHFFPILFLCWCCCCRRCCLNSQTFRNLDCVSWALIAFKILMKPTCVRFVIVLVQLYNHNHPR